MSPVQRTEPTRNQVGEKGASLLTANPETVALHGQICHSTIKRDGTTDSPVQRTEPTRNQVGEKGAALQTAQPRNSCC